MSRRWRTPRFWNNSSRRLKARFLRCKKSAPNFGRFHQRGHQSTKGVSLTLPLRVHHTDQDAIYRATRYRQRLASTGIRPSMCAKGSAYDNAVAESFFSNLKNELVHHCVLENRDSAHAAIFSYIELFYNRGRLHQTHGYRTSVEFEQRYESGT